MSERSVYQRRSDRIKTDVELGVMQKLVDKGMSVSALAMRYEVNESTIRRLGEKYGGVIKFAKKAPSLRDYKIKARGGRNVTNAKRFQAACESGEAKAILDSGISQENLAKKFGVTDSTARKWLRHYGVIEYKTRRVVVRHAVEYSDAQVIALATPWTNAPDCDYYGTPKVV